jgi:guanylate kinase
MRDGEVDGRDYTFLSKEEFREKAQEGAFIEYAEVHGNMYGTLREPMERALDEGKVYLVEIDVQGALQLRELGVEGLYVFIAPPDMATLRDRLVGRGTDAPEVVQRRLQKADDEMREQRRYDHVVVNDDIERALAEVRTLAGLDPAKAEGGGA